MTNANAVHSRRAVLPLKFKLHDGTGDLRTEVQDVYLAVEGPALETPLRWELGQGADALRFDPDEAGYIAHLRIKDGDLQPGALYTATVYKDESGLALGTIAFEIRP